jgi:preprotein translocase subunit YajC
LFYQNETEELFMPELMQSLPMLLGLGGLLIVMYFVMIRPQKKQEKEQNDMRNNLAVGDEITTIGGIIGRVVSIKEETCVIETSHERTKIRILKSAVSRVDVKADAAE